MRILFISISTVPFGSNDLLFYKAAEQCLDSGHEVMISPWDWGKKNAQEYETIRQRGALLHFRKPYIRPRNFVRRQATKIQHLVNEKVNGSRTKWLFAERFRPDVIVISDTATYHFLSAPGLVEFLSSTNIPFCTISQFNAENTSLAEPAYRTAQDIFRKARCAFFVSKRNLEVARRQLCDELKNAVVVHNPPNLSDWSYLAYPASDEASLCMVARLECAVKGQALVLQVLSEPVWRERNWRLSIFGGGPDEAYLRDLVRFLRLDEKVTIRGVTSDLRAVWQEHQILIMASSGEGKPLALTEAMLCGRPSIVTDVGGNAELVSEGETGFVTHSATLVGLREVLERSWKGRQQWEEMGRRAHAAVLQALTPPPGLNVAQAILASVKVRSATTLERV